MNVAFRPIARERFKTFAPSLKRALLVDPFLTAGLAFPVSREGAGGPRAVIFAARALSSQMKGDRHGKPGRVSMQELRTELYVQGGPVTIQRIAP